MREHPARRVADHADAADREQPLFLVARARCAAARAERRGDQAIVARRVAQRGELLVEPRRAAARDSARSARAAARRARPRRRRGTRAWSAGGEHVGSLMPAAHEQRGLEHSAAPTRPGRGVHRQAAGAAHRAGPCACRRVGADAVGGGRAGVGGVLGAGASTASAPVSERVVETEFVFDRLQAAELSAAYRILVPESTLARRARWSGSGPCDEQRSNLCPGLLGPAEAAGDDPIPERGASCARRTAGSGRAETVGV